MRKKWTSFDTPTTNRELLDIPQRDRRALTMAMGRYSEGLEGGFTVKNYGGDLLMIKATNQTSGRCLFFTLDRMGGFETLVALMFYKKESDDAPATLLDAARERRGRFLKDKR